MSGMDIMFKAMGLDPEAMTKSALDFKNAILSLQTGILSIQNDVRILKEQNIQILTLLTQKQESVIPRTQMELVKLQVGDSNA